MALDLLVTASPETLLLAPVVGAYLCVSAMGLLKSGEGNRFLTDLRAHPASLHAVGAVAFFVGAGLLSLHRHWATPPEIIVNVVALWWTFEGAGMLANPTRLSLLFARPFALKQLRIASIVGVPLGAYLLLVGFVGHSS